MKQMTRSEALDKIKAAYETKQLGFQRGTSYCRYYDKRTDSCCAVGVLVKDEALFNEDGNQSVPFNLESYSDIRYAMNQEDLTELHGLSILELSELQRLHDGLIRKDGTYESDFKEYLYSL